MTSQVEELRTQVRVENLNEVAAEFDRVQRAVEVDAGIKAADLRPVIISAIERRLAAAGTTGPC